MSLRKVAGLALAAGVLVSVTGCSFNPMPDTLQSYAPSDGVGADFTFGFHHLEDIKVRNLVVVTDGTKSALFGTVINAGNKAEVVTFTLTSDKTQTQEVPVKAGSTFVFNLQNPTTLPLDGKPGEVLGITISATGKDVPVKQVDVPILDGTIDYYKNLLSPSPEASN